MYRVYVDDMPEFQKWIDGGGLFFPLLCRLLPFADRLPRPLYDRHVRASCMNKVIVDRDM